MPQRWPSPLHVVRALAYHRKEEQLAAAALAISASEFPGDRAPWHGQRGCSRSSDVHVRGECKSGSRSGRPGCRAGGQHTHTARYPGCCCDAGRLSCCTLCRVASLNTGCRCCRHCRRRRWLDTRLGRGHRSDLVSRCGAQPTARLRASTAAGPAAAAGDHGAAWGARCDGPDMDAAGRVRVRVRVVQRLGGAHPDAEAARGARRVLCDPQPAAG